MSGEDLLRSSTTQGRAVYQRILRGRITFTPWDGGYEFEAETRFDKLFIGLVAGRKVERRPGRESFIDPNDRAGMEDERFYTDEDYGRVLERAHPLLESRKANGKRPQRDSNPRFGLERATSWASGRWGLEA